MQVVATEIDGVKLVTLKRHGDDRGFFSEVYSRRDFTEAGIDPEFIQDNHSLSRVVGTIRGLHFQLPPFAQAKFVRVTHGAVLDVVVDIRPGSPTFGRHVAARLSAKDWNALFVPAGFAHGFCTLEPDTEVIYKVTAPYSREHDRGLLWNDPELAIDWPLGAEGPLLSDKDQRWPTLRDLQPINWD